jgi:hypothetical protein
VRHIRIDGNRTGRAVNYWLANKGSSVNIGDVTVSRNVMQAPTGALVIVYGPTWGRRGPYTFIDNMFVTTAAVTDEDARGAFLFAHATGIRLNGNRLRVPPASRLAGVEVRDTTDVAVADNRFTGVTRTLLSDAASRHVTVSPPPGAPPTSSPTTAGASPG